MSRFTVPNKCKRVKTINQLKHNDALRESVIIGIYLFREIFAYLIIESVMHMPSQFH